MARSAMLKSLRDGYGDELGNMVGGLMNVTLGDVLFGVPLTKAQIMKMLNEKAAQALVEIGEHLLNAAIDVAPIKTGRLIESGTVKLKNKIVRGTVKKSASRESPSFVGQRYSRDLPHVGARTLSLYVDVGFNVTYAYWLHDVWTGTLGERSAQKAMAGYGDKYGGVGNKYIARPLYVNLDKYRNHLKNCFPPVSSMLELKIDWNI